MATVITTIYEDGVFKPLRKVNLKNHQRVQITINSQVSAEPSFKEEVTSSELGNFILAYLSGKIKPDKNAEERIKAISDRITGKLPYRNVDEAMKNIRRRRG